MNAPFDLKSVRDQITALMLAYPELADDEVLREDMIEGSTSANEFLSQLIRKIGTTQAIASGTADYIGELQERHARLEQRIHAIRSLIFKVMQAADLKKKELPEATLSIRAGQPKVVIVNEKEIPQDFLRVKTEPDKSRIKAAIGAGEHVPGASLSNGEATLAIITK